MQSEKSSEVFDDGCIKMKEERCHRLIERFGIEDPERVPFETVQKIFLLKNKTAASRLRQKGLRMYEGKSFTSVEWIDDYQQELKRKGLEFIEGMRRKNERR